MSIFHDSALIGSGGGAVAYQINQSLRFDGGASLSRSGTIKGASTFSVWIKRGKLNDTFGVLGLREGATSNYKQLFFEGSGYDSLGFDNSSGGNAYSNNKFRDPSGWFHVVVVSNTTGTGSKMYINGTEVSYRIQTTTTSSDTTGTIYIGALNGGGSKFDGYLAELYVVDSALTPSSFGETDTITGAWIPKKYSGSYGTNGFYLKFDPSATNGIGHDHSGNGNNFTATGFSTSGTGTDVMTDTPTNNHPTIVPINPNYTSVTTTPTDGNLVASFYPNAATGNPGAPALTTFTIPTTGKWYYEFTVSGALNHSWGIAARSDGNNLYDFTLGSRAFWGWYHIYQAGYPSNGNGGFVYSPGSGTVSGGGSLSLGDVIGVAIDFSNSSITFTRNGSSYGTITSCNFSSFTEVVPQWGTGTNGISGATITVNMGQRAFSHTPPSGHKAVCTANLPEPTIKKGDKYFDTKLYTGTGGSQSLSGLGFQPDLVWIKARSTASSHGLYDAVRGVGKVLLSNSTYQEQDYGSYGVTSFNSTGFSVNDLPGYGVNDSGQTYAAWCWDANGAGSSNTAGTITSTVSANATAGFSIVSYSGGTTGSTVGHGLGVAPKMIIVKNRSSASDWMVWRDGFASNEGLNLNNSGAKFTSGSNTFIYDVTSTTFKIGTSSIVNAGSNNFIAYCFSEVAGYSKFGIYNGNGSSDGPFVFCGFRPRWILLKSTSSGSWELYDTARDTYNQAEKTLEPNSSAVEGSGYPIDVLSNGFKVRTSNSQINYSSYSYIFAAFAELPAKYSNAR